MGPTVVAQADVVEQLYATVSGQRASATAANSSSAPAPTGGADLGITVEDLYATVAVLSPPTSSVSTATGADALPLATLAARLERALSEDIYATISAATAARTGSDASAGGATADGQPAAAPPIPVRSYDQRLLPPTVHVQIKGLESDYASVQLTKLEQGSVYDMDAGEHESAGHAGQDSGESSRQLDIVARSGEGWGCVFSFHACVVVIIVPHFAAWCAVFHHMIQPALQHDATCITA
jgi:hypothetical protein